MLLLPPLGKGTTARVQEVGESRNTCRGLGGLACLNLYSLLAFYPHPNPLPAKERDLTSLLIAPAIQLCTPDSLVYVILYKINISINRSYIANPSPPSPKKLCLTSSGYNRVDAVAVACPY